MRNFLTVLFMIFLLLPMRVMADDDAATDVAPGVARLETSVH